MTHSSTCGLSSPSNYAASYSPRIQPMIISELHNRGEMPALSDQSAQLSVPSSISEQPFLSNYTVDVISSPRDSRGPSAPSDLPKCPLLPGQSSREDSSGRPAYLGSPVVLKRGRADPLVGNLTFPLIHSSPIQEHFDFSQEQPLVLNRCTRWLSTGSSLKQHPERHSQSEQLFASHSPGVQAFRSPHPTRCPAEHTNNSTSILKNTMFSSLNKSEPNLINPFHDSSLSIAPSFSSIPTDQPVISVVSSIIKWHKPQLSLSDLKAHLLEVGKVNQTPNFSNNQTFKALFNHTSKRISQFTSRRNGPSPPSHGHTSMGSLPSDDTPLSPKFPAITDHVNQEHQSKALTVSHSPFSSSQPCQMSQLPVIFRITTPAELPKPANITRRNNARIHSPNFYQSLKSRWKSDSRPADNVSGDLPKSLPHFPQVDSHLEQEQPEQQECSTPICHTTELQLQVAESLFSKPMTEVIQSDPEEKGNGIMDTGAGIHQTDPMTPSPNNPIPASTAKYMPPRSAEAADHQLPMVKPMSLTSIEGNPPVGSTPEMIANVPYQGTTQGEIKIPPVSILENAPLDSSLGTLTEANEMIYIPQAKVTGMHVLSGSRDNFFPSTLSPPISEACSNNDLASHVKSSSKQNFLSQEYQPKQTQNCISSEKQVTMVSSESHLTHDKPTGSRRSKSTSVSRHERGAGISSRSTLLNQIDGSNLTDGANLDKMDILEGLLHKNHLNFTSRRSSISKVLQRSDSIGASTPLLFQAIWEKELEENERKWKALAHMGGSQPSSAHTSELQDGIVQRPASALANRDHITSHSSTRTSSHSKKSSRNFCEPGTVPSDELQAHNGVLEKVWDSFKSEAEISLSDINCDGSLVGHFASGFDPLGCTEEADPLDFPPTVQSPICFDGAELQQSSISRTEKPIGLGLFHPWGPPTESKLSTSNDFCPITSPKLKKLSLLSNHPICSSGSSRVKRRPNKSPYQATRTDNSESNSPSLDLSLLNAFPAPPGKEQPNHSSSAPFSLKAFILPDSPRNSHGISSNQMPKPTTERPSKDQTTVNSYASASTLNTATRKLISFTPASFSNRPRAQTSGRCPIPPPLNLRTMPPQRNPDHRRRTLTNATNRNNNGSSGSDAAPPVPLFPAPHTAPLQSRTTFESNNRQTDADQPLLSPNLIRPNFSSAPMNSKLNNCGLMPKRPSLLMRHSLRSPRMAGGARLKETNLPPHPTPAPPIAASPEVCSPSRTTQPVGQSTSAVLAHYPNEQAGCFSSPHTSAGSSTGTASSGSTIPSPTTPTSLSTTYNSRLPTVPMCHSSVRSPILHSPVQSIHPDNPRYVIIDQTPKYSNVERVAPSTIKASRIYRPELTSKAKHQPDRVEQVSYGMAL